jgi:apolipoprotein N-acyltransferase
MDRLADAVILSWGWRRRGLALAAGAFSALAQPPFFAFPILWLTLPVLVWLIDGAVGQGRSGRVRRLLPAFSVGWWFGFGYFSAGLWWIGAAFLVEVDEFGWLLPFAVIALPAGLALFFGLGAALAQLLWSEDWRRIFALAFGLGAAEWLRGHVLSGFPWNALGYALTTGEALMQSAALVGIEGLTVLAVIVFAAPAALAPAGPNGRNLALPGLALAVLAGLGAYGFLRLSHAEDGFVSDTAIRIVQPDLEQLQKWDPANKDEVVETYLRLSAPEGAPLAPGTVLVWPESAFPFALTDEPGVLAAIADLLPVGTALVTGAYRVERLGDAQQVFNSIYVIGDDGAVLDAYDKLHLVPFGEYLPIPQSFGVEALRQFAQNGFSPGPRRRSLNLPAAPPFSPLICYEAVFSGAVLPEGPRPGFLLNVTNDGWFGRTIGPYQHFHQARVRSVEEGLPLVRAANTGISAVVDPYGRIIVSAGLGAATMIESRLPAAIEPTFYAEWRMYPLALLLIASGILAATRNLYPRRRLRLT